MTRRPARRIEAHAADPGEAPARPDEWARWPELAAADQAVLRPELRRPALAMAEILADRAEKKPATEAQQPVAVDALGGAGQAPPRRAASTDEADRRRQRRRIRPDPGVPPWKPVTQTTARSRGEGEPIPHWSSRDGELSHQPGHADDMMYLAVPLRGKFELDLRADRAGRPRDPRRLRRPGPRAQGRPQAPRAVAARPPDARRRHHSAHREGGRMVRAAGSPWTAAG